LDTQYPQKKLIDFSQFGVAVGGPFSVSGHLMLGVRAKAQLPKLPQNTSSVTLLQRIASSDYELLNVVKLN